MRWGAIERLAPLLERGKRLPRRRLAALGAALLAGGAAAIALLPGGGDERASASDPGAPTVPLERRDLTSTVNVDGTLGFTGEAEMINRLQGTFTWLPAVGDVIHRGERAFAVDGEPIILMYGKLPAYRDLTAGVSAGADVRELERNLAALGFDDGGAMTVDDSFTSATAAAIRDWQHSVGLTRTGTVELGRVVFAPGPRRVESVDVALGSNAAGSGSGAGSNGSAASRGYDPAASVPTTLASMRKPLGRRPGKPGSRNSPASNPDSGSSESGNAAGTSSTASTDVLTTTSLRRAVTVDLDANQISLAKAGRPARINLPDGKRAKGRISAVGTTAASSGDSGSGQGDSGSGSDSSSSTVEVTIAIRGRAGGFDQAPVTVDLIDQVRRNVFSVPVGALIGTAGGHYAIVVHQGSERRQIPVEPGLFADSYVEVTGRGLTEGMRVEVPQL